MDGRGWPENGSWFLSGWSDGHDDVRGDFCVADGPYLHHWVHGRGRRLQPLFCLYFLVHFLDVDAGHEQQHAAIVLRLGSCGSGVISAHRILV